MSPTNYPFEIVEHVIPASHIREYRQATLSGGDEELKLAIKQYVPHEPLRNGQKAVTIIGAHANGFPKELYEPLWEELYTRLKARNIHIRSVWIADVAHQGASGLLNEHVLGNDPSWADHPRDLLHMVNHFRKAMIQPIVGVGHSMGGAHLASTALMNPRLFSTLVLIDPVILKSTSMKGNYGPAKASSFRRDIWPSRQEAERKMKTSKFYQTWDPRVLDRWLKYGLRDLPTPLHPNVVAASPTLPPISADTGAASVAPSHAETPVTLTTTKHQEVFTFLRPNFPTPEHPDPINDPDPITHPDVDPTCGEVSPFYRPEGHAIFRKLQHLRPSVLYLYGDERLSNLSSKQFIDDKNEVTGVGAGGSGGVAKGRVETRIFPNTGHLVPMEEVGGVADACAVWMHKEEGRWSEIEARLKAEWDAVPVDKKIRLSDEYLERIQGEKRAKL